MKKVAILMSIARQVEGEYVFVNVVKAHIDPNKLTQYLSENTLPKTSRLGDVDCVLEYGIIQDIEIEED